MKSIIWFCTLVASAWARTTGLQPLTSIETAASIISVDASGSITNNSAKDISGTIEVAQYPFLVGLSRLNESLSGTIGYSKEIIIANDSIADVAVKTEITSTSGVASVALGSQSIIGNPLAIASATVTKKGITKYGLDLGVNADDGDIQMNVQLNGVPKEGVTLQGTTQIGPVAGMFTRDTAGLWDEKVITELVVFENPRISLLGSLHQDTSNELEYVVGINSPVAWGLVHVWPNNSIDYHLGGVISGVQDNVSYKIIGNGAYLETSNVTMYNVTLDVGSLSGSINGELFNSLEAQLSLNFFVFEIGLITGLDSITSFYFEIDLNYAKAQLWLDEKLNPKNLSGQFWSNDIDVSISTDFQGDYNFDVDFQGQMLTFSL